MAKGEKIVLSARQEAWLKLHFKNTKNAELAARLGISETAVHRYARAWGLTKTKAFRKKTQRNAADKAKASHLRNGTYPPNGYRIPRSEEFQFKPGVTNVERLGKRKDRQRIEKAVASRKETMRKEKARALFGLPRKTKMRVVALPHYIACQRHYLRGLGYIIERGGMTAYYTPDTRRSEDYETRTRQTHARYVGFTFLPIDQKKAV